MKFTTFELSVLESLITGDREESILREQLSQATVSNREFTGIGVYVDIFVPENSLKIELSNRYIEGTPMAYLKHPDLNPPGDAKLWFTKWKISTLEMLTLGGEPWPNDVSKFEIEKYSFTGQ